MGVANDLLLRLIELRLAGLIPSRANVCEIGAQQLSNDFLAATELIRKVGAIFGVDKPIDLGQPMFEPLAHGELGYLNPAAPFARDFWLWLGFEHAAIDIDGSPGSIALDLNFDSTPPEHFGKYHLVTNLGTTEDVANQLNAFKVIHELTAPGGLMMHTLPAQGMFNHGLVNYNMKLFWMLARSNGYGCPFVDYWQSSVQYPMPDNIVSYVAERLPRSAAKVASHTGSDAVISITLQKSYDIPFVPPIDIPTGTETNIAPLRKRYWTVFDRDVFRRLAPVRSSW